MAYFFLRITNNWLALAAFELAVRGCDHTHTESFIKVGKMGLRYWVMNSHGRLIESMIKGRILLDTLPSIEFLPPDG